MTTTEKITYLLFFASVGIVSMACSKSKMAEAGTYTPADCDFSNQRVTETVSTNGSESQKPGPAEKANGPEAIELNSAGEQKLKQIPGIGPALAGRITKYRKHRPFEAISDLKRIDGIGEATLEKMKEHIVVRK